MEYCGVDMPADACRSVWVQTGSVNGTIFSHLPPFTLFCGTSLWPPSSSITLKLLPNSAAATDCCAKTWRIPSAALVPFPLLYPSVDLSVWALPLRNHGQAGTYFSIHREIPRGDRFQRRAINYWWRVPLLCCPHPPLQRLRAEGRREKPASPRTNSAPLHSADGLLRDNTRINSRMQFTFTLWNLTANSDKRTTRTVLCCSPNQWPSEPAEFTALHIKTCWQSKLSENTFYWLFFRSFRLHVQLLSRRFQDSEFFLNLRETKQSHLKVNCCFLGFVFLFLQP